MINIKDKITLYIILCGFERNIFGKMFGGLKIKSFLCAKIALVIMNIKSKIISQGFTISKVAKEMDITQPSLSSILKNGNPELNTLRKIADIIGLSVVDLISDDDFKREIRCPRCGQVITLKAE